MGSSVMGTRCTGMLVSCGNMLMHSAAIVQKMPSRFNVFVLEGFTTDTGPAIPGILSGDWRHCRLAAAGLEALNYKTVACDLQR